jgi:hypothetical protein
VLGSILLGVAARADGVEDAPPASPSASELLDRAYRNLYEGDFVQILALTTRSATGRTMTRRLQVTRKQTSPPGKALVRFLEPPDIRGTSLLLLERDDRHDDLFLYLPAFDRIRRVSAAQRADAFFGTLLTYEDLEPKQAKNYEARFAGRDVVEGVPCVLLEVRPRPEIQSDYERIEPCIDPDRAVALRTDYWVKGRRIKRSVSPPRRIQAVEGRSVPFETRIRSDESGTETLLVTESYEIRAEIADDFFTAKQLMQGDEKRDREQSRTLPPAAVRP